MDTTPQHNAPNWAIFHAQDNGHIDSIGIIVLGVAFLWLLLAYMRVQGRYRKAIENQLKQERAKR